jgi:hypothetical protein
MTYNPINLNRKNFIIGYVPIVKQSSNIRDGYKRSTAICHFQREHNPVHIDFNQLTFHVEEATHDEPRWILSIH